MALIRTGTIKVAASGVAQTLNLGFLPDTFYMRNDTIFSSGTYTGVVEVWYDSYLNGLSTAYNTINTLTTGVAAALLASPACVAVTLTAPAAIECNLPLTMVAFVTSLEAQETGKPELAVAPKV